MNDHVSVNVLRTVQASQRAKPQLNLEFGGCGVEARPPPRANGGDGRPQYGVANARRLVGAVPFHHLPDDVSGVDGVK